MANLSLLNDLVTKTRDILRSKPAATPGDIQTALALPSTKLAQQYIARALEMEADIAAKLNGEVAEAGEADMQFFVLNPKNGVREELVIAKQRAKEVVFKYKH